MTYKYNNRSNRTLYNHFSEMTITFVLSVSNMPRKAHFYKEMFLQKFAYFMQNNFMSKMTVIFVLSISNEARKADFYKKKIFFISVPPKLQNCQFGFSLVKEQKSLIPCSFDKTIYTIFSS